jgi:hypothetical protein
VAAGRARRIGRGGDTTSYSSSFIRDALSPLTIVSGSLLSRAYAVRVLIPELADSSRILDVLEGMESDLSKIIGAEGEEQATYRAKPELLPLDLQMVLKEVVETAATAVLNAEYFKWIRNPIGSLLVACDPRAVEVEVSVEARPGRATYSIRYSCKSHVDNSLRLEIELDISRSLLSKSVWVSGTYQR